MSPAHLPMGDKIKHMQPMSVIRLTKKKEAKGKRKLWSPSPSECEPADNEEGSLKPNMTLFNLLISETPQAICQETSPVATMSVMYFCRTQLPQP